MSTTINATQTALSEQQNRNEQLIRNSRYMRDDVVSRILPFSIDIDSTAALSNEQADQHAALSIEGARIALSSLASLAKIGELDHLGGGLELIPALLMTLAVMDEKKAYTIEHAHTSIGYYSSLSALGYLDDAAVIDEFRRGLDIAGHVSWVPGGTELNGGRLGVMIPCAVGQALGMRARLGEDSWSVCHVGDAGYISGQALNGFNGADLHGAPITFVMHRNGIQLSGSTRRIMDKDPRPIIESLGISIIETRTLMDSKGLFEAYREARDLAKKGRPSLIYPIGWGGETDVEMDLKGFGEMFGIGEEVGKYAVDNGIDISTKIWLPGSLMSWRDVGPMIENVLLVNDLPGGKGHHDGHMKGRELDDVLANPMMRMTEARKKAWEDLKGAEKIEIVTKARPAPGSSNLIVPKEKLADVKLKGVGESDSPRSGSQAGYEAVAKAWPKSVFVVSCDLDTSTKLDKAVAAIPANQQFEMSIEEQASALMADGLAVSSKEPQLNVMSTFAAFFEGIAREGFEVWRYLRNLNGANEGLNVVMHLSHVGACTGRDHFSGWALNWINVVLDYLPYLHRGYAPADARAAFVATIDQAAHYGAHIMCIPRDKLPILSKQDSDEALYNPGDDWEEITDFRQFDGARRAILAFGAPAFLAGQAAEELSENGTPTNAHIVNGLPVDAEKLAALIERYPEGIVTIEDGLIGDPASGIRGFAGVAHGLNHSNVPCKHIGIVDPTIAPSEGHMEVWEHFGITKEAAIKAVERL